MIYRELLTRELSARKEDFADFAASQARDVEAYLQELERLADDPGLLDRLPEFEGPGAIPGDEFNNHRGFAIDFEESWKNHEEARKWAERILAGRTTFAADGSQIYVQKETSLPVGAIQIGWFENPHEPGKKYERDVSFELLTPRMLLENQEEPLNPETRIGERRFHAEVERFHEFLEKHKGWQERKERMPVAFFDGTLLVSFSLPQTSLQESFLKAMLDLVRKSAAARVPLVGYVDRSFARDLVKMVSCLNNSLEETSIYDSTLLSASTSEKPAMLNGWGNRTVFCESKRKGLEMFTDEETGRALVGFTYLQTTADSGPARLDVPSWIYDDGLIDELIDVVRAECVVGLGYPYPLETADATALISHRDREAFLAALREFTSNEGIEFNVSRKAASKARRR
ncbi:MAG: DNA double-strand break repair nuclease NurA [Pyrinomonadaceae bacterium]|nr:DNA double-strand break repair nuclease NurA [Pyrinomonadaceae bacterium]